MADQPPVLDSLLNRTAHPGKVLSFFANATDAQNYSLTFALVNPPAGANINSTTGQFTWLPGWNQLGNQTVTIRVSDPNGLSDQKPCTVNVGNQAPTLDVLPNRTAHPGKILTFFANAADPEGDTLQFSLVNPPAGATINSTSGQFSWTPSWNQMGNQTVIVQVTDPGGLSDQKQCTITVANQAPVMDPLADRLVTHGTLLKFFANAADPDGDSVQFQLTNNPPQGAAVDANSGRFTWTPAQAQVGAVGITIQASDPGTLTDQKQCTITVQ